MSKYLKIDRSKPRDVVAFGRATIDLYANETGTLESAPTFSQYVGGSPANTAVAMAQLGLDVGYIGKVSDDPLGRFVVQYLQKKGVDVSEIATAEPGIRTGITIGEMVSPAESNYYMYRSNCADLHISCGQLDEAYISRFKLLLISGTSLTRSPAREAVFLAVELARRNGVAVSFDLDFREGTWSSPEEAGIYYTLMARQADMVLGTREEFDAMEALCLPGNRDDAVSAKSLLSRGVQIVVIKKGKKGSTVYTQHGDFKGGIYPTNVLKTFGAGDAYSAAVTYGLLNELPMQTALQYAAAASSLAITGHSCSDAMPSLSQVQDFVQQHTWVLE